MPWFEKPPTDKPITIIEVEDWTAIFVGDKQVHWHDTLCTSELLHRLGFDVHSLSNDEESALEFIQDVHGDINMPNSLSELKSLLAAECEGKLQGEIDAKQKELDELRAKKVDVQRSKPRRK